LGGTTLPTRFIV